MTRYLTYILFLNSEKFIFSPKKMFDILGVKNAKFKKSEIAIL